MSNVTIDTTITWPPQHFHFIYICDRNIRSNFPCFNKYSFTFFLWVEEKSRRKWQQPKVRKKKRCENKQEKILIFLSNSFVELKRKRRKLPKCLLEIKKKQKKKFIGKSLLKSKMILFSVATSLTNYHLHLISPKPPSSHKVFHIFFLKLFIYFLCCAVCRWLLLLLRFLLIALDRCLSEWFNWHLSLVERHLMWNCFLINIHAFKCFNLPLNTKIHNKKYDNPNVLKNLPPNNKKKSRAWH